MSYGAVAKFLHWSIVILIISQYVIIEAAEELPDGPASSQASLITSRPACWCSVSRWYASPGSS